MFKNNFKPRAKRTDEVITSNSFTNSINIRQSLLFTALGFAFFTVSEYFTDKS